MQTEQSINPDPTRATIEKFEPFSYGMDELLLLHIFSFTVMVVPGFTRVGSRARNGQFVSKYSVCRAQDKMNITIHNPPARCGVKWRDNEIMAELMFHKCIESPSRRVDEVLKCAACNGRLTC